MSARYLIVAGRFNDLISKALLAGAQETLAEHAGEGHRVDVLWVPGCFEMPTIAAEAARGKAYDAVICLGAVIRGDTPHFDYVAGQCAAGLQQVGIATGIPTIFGVLTTDTVEQALSRCGIKSGNKGADAAHAAIAMVKTMARLKELTKR